jgi:hypothetical protein
MKSEEKEELIGGLVVAGFTALLGFGLFSILKYLARKELSNAIQESQHSFTNASLKKTNN